MINNELVSALRNALAHGSSLEEAVKSFINAGYPATEVREAAQLIGGGATQFVSTQQAPQSPPVQNYSPQTIPQSLPQSQQQPSNQSFSYNKQELPKLPTIPSNNSNPFQEEKKTSWLPWIIGYLIFLLLLIITGLVIYFFFPNIIGID